MNAKQLAKACIESVMELAKVAASEVYELVDIVAFDVPHEEDRVYAAISAGGGRSFTLILLCGPDALALQAELERTQDSSLLERRATCCITVGMRRMKVLPPEHRRLLERAEYPPSRLAPCFVVKAPGETTLRAAHRDELELCLAVTQGYLVAAREGRLEGRFRLGIVTRLRVDGDLRRPQVRRDLISLETGEVVDRDQLLAHPEFVAPEAMPAAGDRAAWKRTDQDLASKLAHTCKRGALSNEKARSQYLGELHPEDGPDQVVQDQMVGYLEWYVTWYRGQPKAPTVLESLFEKSRRPAERAMLEARMKGRVSVFEVLASPSELAFEAKDLLTGETLLIDDGGLATHCPPGTGLILHVYAIGDFQFVTLLGPHFAPGRAPQVLDALAELGLGTDPKAWAERPHLVGRLWARATELQTPTMPTLQNSDRDPLLWHKIAYLVQDPEALGSWFAQTPDIEHDEETGQWLWLRAEDQTILGQLQMIGDHMLVEVNSVQRCDRIRALLDAVPGMKFESQSTQEVSPSSQDQLPLDDRLGRGRQDPTLDSSDALAAVQQILTEQCMAWLDECLPMLDGRTPRETCATLAGRKQVRESILSYANPLGPPGLEVPRAAMLAELGLTNEPA